MFTGILQRVLNTLVGKYIQIDPKQIDYGISSGNLTIKDLKIKKEALEALELPLDLNYSNIQSLSVTVPWREISTKRAEIKIKNVYLLVSTKDQSNWNMALVNDVKEKIKTLEFQIKRYLDEQAKQMTQKQEKQEVGGGYWQKVIAQLIDNLYIDIQNIHIRYEHKIGRHNFSWGLTVQRILQETLDKQGNTFFHDRFTSSDTYLNKQLDIQRLACYWNSDDQLLLSSLPKEIISQKMQQEIMIQGDMNGGHISSKYIFSINMLAKVVQTYQHNYQIPEYKVQVELQNMEFRIKHTQVQEILKVGQLFKDYQSALKTQRDMYKIICVKPEKSKHRYAYEFFIYLVNKVRIENLKKKYIEYYLKGLQKSKQPIKLFKRKELNSYIWMIKRTPIEQLCDWSKRAIEINNSNAIQQTKWWHLKKQMKEEDAKLRQIINSALWKQESIDLEGYVHTEFTLLMKTGSIRLLRKQKHLEEGFNIVWKNFTFNIQKRENNHESELILQDMEISMFSVEEKNDIVVPIVRKMKHQQLDKPLVFIRFEKHPLLKPNIFSSLIIDVQALEIVLYIASMNRILAYFRVPPSEDRPPQRIEVKVTAEQAQNLIQHDQKNEIKILIQSPIVIIPIKQINDQNSDCWVIKLGDIDFQTQDDKKKNRLSAKRNPSRMASEVRISEIKGRSIPSFELHQGSINNIPMKFGMTSDLQQGVLKSIKQQHVSYDRYELLMKSVQMQYFSSIHYFYNYQKFSGTPKGVEILNNPLRLKSLKLDIVQQLTLTLNIKICNDPNVINKAATKIKFDLPLLKATITSLVPQTMQRLSQAITNLSQDQTLSSILQLEKMKLLKYATAKGYLRKRGTFFRSWSTYYCILSGWYLYFYQNENDDDFDSYISLRNVQASESAQDIGVPFSFKIKSPIDTIYFQCGNLQEQKRWLKLIMQKVHDIRQKLGPQILQPINKVDVNKSQYPMHELNTQSNITFKGNFLVRQLEVILKYDNDTDSRILIEQIKLRTMSKISQSLQLFSIKRISVEDDHHPILNSINFQSDYLRSRNQTKAHFDIIDQQFDKMKQIINIQEFESNSAIKLKIFQSDNLSKSGNSVDMLFLLSDIQIMHKTVFVNKLMKFTAKETPVMEQQQDPKSNQLIFTKVPANLNNSDFKSIQTLKSLKSVSHLKSMSDIDLPQERYTQLHLISKDIKIHINENQTDLMLINVSKIYASIRSSDDVSIISGRVYRIEIIDMFSLKSPHIFLGLSQKIHKPKSGLTIFTQKESTGMDDVKNMVEFTITNYSENNLRVQNDTYNDIQLKITDCFIDYLHQTISLVQNYISRQNLGDKKKQQPKSDVIEIDKDEDQIFNKVFKPKLTQISFTLIKPKIMLKPLQGQNNFQLEIDSIALLVYSQKEKNRFLNISKAGKKQTQIVQQLESVWCQNIELVLENMQISIKDYGIEEISNRFSAVLRLQTPMFTAEYETLFPNITLDKNKEMRLKISHIELNLIRSNFLILMEVLKQQLSAQPTKQKQNDNQKQESPQSESDTNWIFSLSILTVKLLEADSKLPVIDFQMKGTQIYYSLKKNLCQELKFSVEHFSSNYYQYSQKGLNHIVFQQGIINTLQNDKKTVQKFLQQYRQVIYEDWQKVLNEIKSEYYKNEIIQEHTQELYINADIDKEGNKKVQIFMSESKVLLNSFYFQTIANFFKIEKKTEQSQQSPTNQNSNKETLLDLDFQMKRSLILLKGESLQTITIQCEVAATVEERFGDWLHKDYHDVTVKSMQKSRQLKVQVNQIQIFSSLFDNLVKVNPNELEVKLLKKRLILRPTALTYESNYFKCSCNEFHDIITNDHLKLEKIRIHIAYQDMIHIIDTIEFQKTQLSQSKQIFTDKQDESLQEDEDHNTPLKPMDLAISHPELNFQQGIIKSNPKVHAKLKLGVVKVLNQKVTSLKKVKTKNTNQFDDLQIFNDDGHNQDSDHELLQQKDSIQLLEDGQQKQIQVLTSRNIDLSLIELVIINDLALSYVPLVLLGLEFQNVSIEDNNVTQVIQIDHSISLNYFNPVASRMEPIIEQANLTINIFKNYHSEPKQTINIYQKVGRTKTLGNALINLNFSIQMLVTLSRSIRLWSQKFAENKVTQEPNKLRRIETRHLSRINNMNQSRHSSNSAQNENQDKVTLFTLSNKTGYNIKLIRESNNLEIQNNEQKNYLIDSDTQDYAKTFNSEHTLVITFQDYLNRHCQITTIPDMTTKSLIWREHCFICHTSIHALNKSVNLLSPYMFINKTDCTILLRLYYQESLIILTLEPDDDEAIPIQIAEKCHFTIQFQDKTYSRNSQQSQNLNLKTILSKNITEVVHQPFYTLIHKNTEEIQGVTYIEFLPLFTLQNCLPIPMRIFLASPQIPDLQSQLLSHYMESFSSVRVPLFRQSSTIQIPKGLLQVNTLNDYNREGSLQAEQKSEFIRIEQGLIELAPQASLPFYSISVKDSLSMKAQISGYPISGEVHLISQNGNPQNNQISLDGININIERDLEIKFIYFFINHCIINTTPSELWFYTLQDDKCKQLSGQNIKLDYQNFEKQYNYILPCNRINNIMISLKDSNEISNELNIAILGSFSISLVHNKQLYEFGIHISIIELFKGFNCKVIEVMPRFVIINETGMGLFYRQSNSSQVHEIVDRHSVIWSDCTREKSIQFQVNNGSWSGDIFVQELRSTHFYSLPYALLQESQIVTTKREQTGIYKKFNLTKYDPADHISQERLQTDQSQKGPCIEFSKDSVMLSAQITQTQATNFILIESQNESNYAYRLINRCSYFRIIYNQQCYGSKHSFSLAQGKQIPFAWEFPSQNQKLSLSFQYLSQTIFQEVIDFKNFVHEKSQIVKIDDKDILLKIKVEFQGVTRVVICEDILAINSLNVKQEECINKIIDIHLDSIGISLITYNQKKLVEANYIYFRGISVHLVESNIVTKLQTKIKFLNIDNNSSQNTTTPINLTVKHLKSALQSSSYNFLDISISKDHNIQAIQKFNTINIQVKPIQVQLDDAYLNVIMESQEYINSQSQDDDIMEYNGLLQSVKKLVFMNPKQREYSLKLMTQVDTDQPYLLWKSLEISKQRKLIYIRDLSLPMIEVDFSFHKRFHHEDNFSLLAIGTSFQNINDARIKLSGLELSYIYDSTEILTQTIKSHYKTEAIKSLLKVVGQIEIIGDPVHLVETLATGLVDFVEMPYDGIQQGPIQFGVGVVRGTGSLVKNTVAGVFASMNKLTASLSANISLLSVDDQYLERRRQFMLQKPNNVIEGLSQAGESLYDGFSQGLTGIVMQPIRQTQRDGFKGLLVGTVQGISGFIVKPISGVLDASAKTAETIAVAATHFDDKANDKRIRPPRQITDNYFGVYEQSQNP